jgi:hypothetical protein
VFILRDLLPPLQAAFSNTTLGRERATWFTYTLLAVVVPFTSSMSANLLRTLTTLFGLALSQRRFYTFMASPTLPWERLWRVLWGLIPTPLTEGRLVVALDDFINPKVGRKIFACESIFDHAAKSNQSKYPWAQNVVAIGLLQRVKGRWACLPLAFRFYLPEKTLKAKTINVIQGGKVPPFQTKLAQAGAMIIEVAAHFAGAPVLVVTDSWFGNNGLFKPVREALGLQFHLLSRLRVTSMLYDLPPERRPKQRGTTRTYGQKLGSAADLAARFRPLAQRYRVHLYGKSREVLAYERVFMLKTLKCPVRVVWVYRKSQYVALFTTDLRLSVEQIIELYGARWKIESGFKELKQEIGSQKSQTRNAYAVTNHLQFCMMAVTLTWIYAARLQPNPQRRHKVKGRTSFAFSDVRRIIAEAALSEDFEGVCPKPTSPPDKSLVATLLRMVA